MENYNFDITPITVMSDIEKGLMKSLKLSFPSINIIALITSMAVWRKVQSTGLRSSYTNDVNYMYKKLFQKVIVLAFIPQQYVMVA